MDRHRGGWRSMTGRFRMSLFALAAGACAALTVAGCATVVSGQAISPLYDPAKVGGLPVTDGPSGPRPDAPATTGTVKNTDDGEVDHLSLLSVNDIQDFWDKNYTGLPGSFTPVEQIISYDSTDPDSPAICGRRTYKLVNAFYNSCGPLIAWDRGVMFKAAQKYYGDIAITGVLAHEYGHALQVMAKLVDRSSPTIVWEQQADCFAGVYLHWVAEGKSSRFTMSTTDGLNHVLAGIINGRDPLFEEGEESDNAHGSALDRISAFQMGFDTGSTLCAAIDEEEIEQRRGDLPIGLREDASGEVESGDLEITEEVLTNLMAVMNQIFKPKNAPTLSFDATACPDAQASPPASYCPATNTISVDLPALQQMGAPANEDTDKVLLQGDNTALSVVMSRYALAVQHEHGVPLTSAMAGLRTACLTGVGQRGMAEPVDVPPEQSLILSAGDLDEAVTGLLGNGLAASDVNGGTVPAGYSRILAFRSGVLGTEDQCYQRFP